MHVHVKDKIQQELIVYIKWGGGGSKISKHYVSDHDIFV